MTPLGNENATNFRNDPIRAKNRYISQHIDKKFKNKHSHSRRNKQNLVYEARKRGIGVNYLEFRDPVEYSQLPSLLKCADIGIVALDSSSSNFSLPSKTFSYLACGLPLIAITANNSSLASLIKINDCGWVFDSKDPSSPTSLISLLTSIIDDDSLLDNYCSNAINVYRSYSPENVYSIITPILNKILNDDSCHS